VKKDNIIIFIETAFAGVTLPENSMSLHEAWLMDQYCHDAEEYKQARTKDILHDWRLIPREDLEKYGDTCLSYTSAAGWLYYLPALLINELKFDESFLNPLFYRFEDGTEKLTMLNNNQILAVTIYLNYLINRELKKMIIHFPDACDYANGSLFLAYQNVISKLNSSAWGWQIVQKNSNPELDRRSELEEGT
jgi:hypothetical protein